jgi:hypothetical protein
MGDNHQSKINIGAMLGFGAGSQLNNTAFRAKSITEFPKYKTTQLFFSCGGAGGRAIVGAVLG